MSDEQQEVVRLEGVPSEPVDLVIYLGPERVVVGKAGINPDGTMRAEFFDDVSGLAKDIIGNVLGEFSFRLPRKIILDNQPAFTAGDLPFDGDVPQSADGLIHPVDQ